MLHSWKHRSECVLLQGSVLIQPQLTATPYESIPTVTRPPSIPTVCEEQQEIYLHTLFLDFSVVQAKQSAVWSQHQGSKLVFQNIIVLSKSKVAFMCFLELLSISSCVLLPVTLSSDFQRAHLQDCRRGGLQNKSTH